MCSAHLLEDALYGQMPRIGKYSLSTFPIFGVSTPHPEICAPVVNKTIDTYSNTIIYNVREGFWNTVPNQQTYYVLLWPVCLVIDHIWSQNEAKTIKKIHGAQPSVSLMLLPYSVIFSCADLPQSIIYLFTRWDRKILLMVASSKHLSSNRS